MYPSTETNELEITENFYHELTALTIDPKIELEKLQYLSIVSNKNTHAIFRFIKVCTRGNKFYAEVQQMTPAVEDKNVLVAIQNQLAEHLKAKGIPIKR